MSILEDLSRISLDFTGYHLDGVYAKRHILCLRRTGRGARLVDDRATFIWAEEDPMATYLLTLVVGHYQRIDAPSYNNTSIRHYIFKEDPDASNVLQETDDILHFLTAIIAPYLYDTPDIPPQVNGWDGPPWDYPDR